MVHCLLASEHCCGSSQKSKTRKQTKGTKWHFRYNIHLGLFRSYLAEFFLILRHLLQHLRQFFHGGLKHTDKTSKLLNKLEHFWQNFLHTFDELEWERLIIPLISFDLFCIFTFSGTVMSRKKGHARIPLNNTRNVSYRQKSMHIYFFIYFFCFLLLFFTFIKSTWKWVTCHSDQTTA